MRQVVYALLLAGSTLLPGCSEKREEPKPVAASEVRIVLSGSKYGTFSSPRVTLSQSSVALQQPADVLVTAPVVTALSNGLADLNPISTTTWSKDALRSRTLYASLYFEDIESVNFVPPWGVDRVVVSIRVDKQPAIQLFLNSSVLQDPRRYWQDAQGRTNAGVNVQFTY